MEKRKERSKMLHILSEKKKRAFYEENIGTERTVLFESEEEQGIMFGFTENYIKVKSVFNPELINTFQKVTLEEIDRDGIMKVAFIDK
jgi:threonylcarbamoyladenosine tRNA methylthiotransferase MtaB